MPRPSPEALRAAQEFHLTLFEAPPRGVAGERLGKGTGASLEFQDRRAYALGDDVRHLDWRSYARTDQLLVRQYREEIAPRVDVVLDVSRSMTVDERKAQLAVDLALVVAGAGRRDGFQTTILCAGERPELLDFERFAREGADCDGGESWDRVLDRGLGLLRRGSLRILIGDFLFPHAASELVRPLAARSGGLALVQVLAPFDRDPDPGGALRLVDAESGAATELVLDVRTVRRYRERVTRLSEELEVECRRAGALFAAVDAEQGIDAACRGRLIPAGLLGIG